MARNTSGLWLDLLMKGVAADRPASPSTPPQTFCYYFATDTGDLSVYIGSAWALVGNTNGGNTQTGQTTITASTTHTIAGGTKLLGKYNNITVCANAGDAVVLPALPNPGAEIWVFNNGAAAGAVYPGNAADQIDAVSAGGSVTLTNAKGAVFVCYVAGKWSSYGIASHSA